MRLQLWDIAGQERFGNMTRVYYKEAVGAFVVFDLTRIDTFDAVAQWKADIDAKVTWGEDDKPIPVVLLANKCDLEHNYFGKTKEDMDAYCQEHGFLGWFETSAKDNKGIEEASKALVQYILDNDIKPIAPEAQAGVIDDIERKPASGAQSNDGGCC